MTANYTPIDDMVPQKAEPNYSLPHEAEPPTSRDVEAAADDEVQEVVDAEPSNDVAEVVETKKETVKLPDELKGFGITTVDATNFPAYQNIQLPISDDEVVIGAKAPPSSPMRWLSTLAQYTLWKVGLRLKVIHGKVVRVVVKRA